MARIRTIKPCFFRHEGLYDAEKAHGLPLRLAFAGLWTAADREGRFAWKPRELKLDCLPHDDVDFSRVLDALATRGFIVKYSIEEKLYGFIPSWHEHQVINNRESASRIPQPNETSVLTRAPRVSNVCPTPLVQAQGEGKGKEGKGKEGDIDAWASSGVACAPPAVIVGNLFLQFWKAYPSRDGANPKEPARKKFSALIKGGENADAIVAAAAAYADQLRPKGQIGTQYVAQAITWLDERRWLDYAARPADAEQDAKTNEAMAAKGYVWLDGRWQKEEETMPV